jgi:hypothetical protein
MIFKTGLCKTRRTSALTIKKPGPNLNLMTTFLTIFTFTLAIFRCYNITKLKKMIF